jgi:general secretion pathway protein D
MRLQESTMARVRGKYRRLILITLALFAGIGSGACVTSSKYVEQSKELAVSGDWDRSVQLLQKAHDRNPGDLEIKLMLKRARSNASIKHMARGEKFLQQGLLEEAMQEFQTSIAFNPGNIRSAALIEKTKDFRQSRFLFEKGQKLLKAGEYAKARDAFEQAIKLNPNNLSAQKALAAFRKNEKEPPRFRLKLRSTAPVSLKFKKTPITNVFEVLSKLTDINFIFDKDIPETKVTLFMTDVSLDRFLDVLLRTSNLAGKLVDARTMIIYPNTPAKIKEYEDLQIRTFYLSNLKVKDAVSLLTKILNSRDIIANEKLNALVIRGPEALIKIASKIIEANDRPTPEVLLNVEILEVTRTKERQLGLDINPTSITFGIGENSPHIRADSSFAPNVSLHALGKITNRELLLSIPTATLNLLKQDADTKTLASPQIRVNNGEKATIHVGERVPLQVNRRIDTTGVVTYDYQYQDIGVKVEAQPNVNFNDEISLKLSLEVSALGANLGTIDDPEYSITTRETNTVLTMRDSEPVIIGGLIQDEERKTVTRVPLLGDIPIIGTLFSSLDKSKVQTDILMAITPIIIRSQDIPSRNVSEIWSGKESDFSQSVPYESIAEQEAAYYMRPKGVKGPAKKANLEKAKSVIAEAKETPPPVAPPQSGAVHSPSPGPVPLSPGKVMKPHGGPEHAQAARSAPEPSEKQTKSMVQQKEANTPLSSKPEEKKYQWPSDVQYSIHVSSYASRSEAMNRLEHLAHEKYDCFLVPVDIPGMGFYFRIFVGGFHDYASATARLKNLRGKRGFPPDIHVADRRWAFGG